ncbi:hypothetical protein COL77_17060 [Bacillus wiedmannii]|uniref:hypothetical protein n=1 Tax=Bacillus wiedmannii TaxID=1890302 RepID=UPI000BF1DBD7|nr:hypothetical protein [Bacillus wiedmannii]PEJ46590.1 hypothetical protein CN676_25085 [Bacillus wiedmannii]PFZ41778.1 hypothetical protein COL77_17060 [Bacillus wiedmannii]PGA80383.1 hypothetical protein COL94_27120 [Bacillus wiedmannii]
MVTINLVLGIIASILSISSIIFSKKVSAKNKEIEQYLKQELNITLDSSKKDVLSRKKAVSGENGNSIIGDGNSISGGK